MKKILQIIIVLTAVGLIAGAGLALVYKYTSPLIARNQKKATEDAIYEVFPDGKSYEKVNIDSAEVYSVKDRSGKDLGYAFIAQGNGYQGAISMMAGSSPDFQTLTGIEILDSQETPGLGQEITSDNFRSQFRGLKTTPEINYVKGKKPSAPNEIEAITGATISSRAVVSIINATIEKIKKAVK